MLQFTIVRYAIYVDNLEQHLSPEVSKVSSEVFIYYYSIHDCITANNYKCNNCNPASCGETIELWVDKGNVGCARAVGWGNQIH